MEAHYSFLRATRHEAKATTNLSHFCMRLLKEEKNAWVCEADFNTNETHFLDLVERIYFWCKEIQAVHLGNFYAIMRPLLEYTTTILEQWYTFPWHKALSASALVDIMTWLNEQQARVIFLYQKGFHEGQAAAQWKLSPPIQRAFDISETKALKCFWSYWFEIRLDDLEYKINRQLSKDHVEEKKAFRKEAPQKDSGTYLVYRITQKVQRGIYPVIDKRNVDQVYQLFQRNEDITRQGLHILFEGNDPFIHSILRDKKQWEDEQKTSIKQSELHYQAIRQFFQLKKEALETCKILAAQRPPIAQKKGGIPVGTIRLGDLFEHQTIKYFVDHFFHLLTQDVSDISMNRLLTFWKQALQRLIKIKDTRDIKTSAFLDDLLSTDIDALAHYTERTAQSMCSSWQDAVQASQKGTSLQTYLEKHHWSIHSDSIIQQFLTIQLPIYLDRPQRQRHTYILGKSGSGKTELLKYLIHQDIQAGNGVFVLDPHGDLAQECLRFKLFEQPTYKDRLVYISPECMNQGFVPQYNPFDYIPTETTVFERRNALSVRAKELSKSFESFFGNDFTPNMKLLLGNCIKLLLEAPHVHLGHLIDLLYPNGTGTTPYENILATHHDSALRQYFTQIFPAGRLDLAKTALITRLDEATSNQFFKHMLYAPTSSFNFRALLAEGKIIIINASQAKLSRDGTHILGALLTAEMTIMALGRANQSASKRKPIFAYIDECQNFLNDGIDKLLAEGRKYGVHLLMANQFLGQFDGMSRLKQSIFANTAIKLCGSASVKDQTAMAKELKYTFDSNLQLGKGRFVCGIEGYKGIVIQTSNKLLSPLDENTHYTSKEGAKTILQEQLEQYYHQIDLYTGQTKRVASDDTLEPSSDDAFVPEIDDL